MENNFLCSSQEEALLFDIKRTILLGNYIRHWGMPLNRVVCRKKDSAFPVEVYEFPPQQEEGVHRFVTIGVSSQTVPSGLIASWELLFCLPAHLGGSNATKVTHFLLDIMAYSLRADVDVRVGTLIPESALAPETWTTKAVVFDEARGEPEEMSCFMVGEQYIDLLWLIPILGSEYNLIQNKGIEDGLGYIEEKLGVSLLNVNRSEAVFEHE